MQDKINVVAAIRVSTTKQGTDGDSPDAQKINTLEHTGFKYNWSVYSPSKKTGILEAERAKDEMRDIMSHMIGAEIRYTQIGYYMRQAPYGYTSEKIETPNGKRCILKPHETEGALVRKLFELRAAGVMNDSQIADELNRLGFRTRVQLIRDKNDTVQVENRRKELEAQIKVIIDHMKLVSSPTAIKYMEEDLVKLEQESVELDSVEITTDEEQLGMPRILTYIKYFAEHLQELLLHHRNPLNQAAYFGVLFDKTPSYDILADGTQKIAQIPGVNELFRLSHATNLHLVTSPGIRRRFAPLG